MPLPILTYPSFPITVPSTQTPVSIRPMLVAEDKILLMAKESGNHSEIFSAMRQVVMNCIETGKSMALTLFDLEYLFIKIRGISVSNVLNVSYKDAEDNKTYDFEIDIDKDITVKFPEPAMGSLIIFRNNGFKFAITLKYPPATLYGDKDFLDTERGNFFETLVYKCIDNLTVNDEPCTFSSEEFRSWAERLPLDVYGQIRGYFENLPTLHCELNYKNSKGHDRKIVLSTLEDFFTLR